MILAWLAVKAALAAPEVLHVEDAGLADVLVEELARQQALALPDSPRIYHLRYKLLALDEIHAYASLGGLVSRDEGPRLSLGVEVRVGGPEFDNTGLGGWRNGFRAGPLPRSATPHAVRLAAWRLTDRAYKDAVEQLARKRAQAVLPPDHAGDYVLSGPVRHDGGRVTSTVDPEALATLAVEVSAALAAEPGLELGEVHVGHEAGAAWIVDTEGTRVRRPVAETSVRAIAHVVTADGQRLTDERLWLGRGMEDLPALEDLRSEAMRMGRELGALIRAPRLDVTYVGPVVFEDAAAADLFRWLLLPQLEGTPPEVPFDSFIGDIGRAGADARLRRRALPPGWRVVDDPTALPDHPGAFTHDAEGTPTEPVTAIEDGIVHALLTTRTPRPDQVDGNGHGRLALADRATGRPSLTFVEAPRTLSGEGLRARALKAAKAYGLDHVLVVRRLQHPSLRWRGDRDGQPPTEETLPPPVSVVRLYRDGREEVLRGARFVGASRFVLRDVLAAGPSVIRDLLAPWNDDPTRIGPTEGVPGRIVAPAVVVGEMELVGDTVDGTRVRSSPPPTMSGDAPEEGR